MKSAVMSPPTHTAYPEPAAALVVSSTVRRQAEGDDDCYDTGDCWQCGGEGYVASCFDECACFDPESGCDMCTRKCDVCYPPNQKQREESAALRQVLADALARVGDA